MTEQVREDTNQQQSAFRRSKTMREEVKEELVQMAESVIQNMTKMPLVYEDKSKEFVVHQTWEEKSGPKTAVKITANGITP